MANTLKIYSDLDLTFTRLPGTGDVAMRYDDQAVIASVRNLLLTNFYERPFQPKLGSNVDALLFEPINDLTASILENEVQNVINNFEPRVQIKSINAIANPDKNSFSVNLEFYIGNNTSPTAVNLILQRSR
jgi:phage baseplate assembly protein W